MGSDRSQRRFRMFENDFVRDVNDLSSPKPLEIGVSLLVFLAFFSAVAWMLPSISTTSRASWQ